MSEMNVRSNADRPRRARSRSGRRGPSDTTEVLEPAVPQVVNALPPVETPTGFAALGVPDDIDAAIAMAGFAEPFAIQTEAIPVAMTGADVCGRARTGSGKTLAFGIPMIARIEPGGSPRRPRGLVLVPTRELAQQVAGVLDPIARHAGRSVLAVYGGSSRGSQIRHLDNGIDIVVATPLRLIDLLKAGELELNEVEVLVLDEADRMADDGFTPQVEWIMRRITHAHQTMLFSATLDGDVGHLIKHFMTNPVEVSLHSATETVGTMHHVFLAVHHMDKDKVVAKIASQVERTIVFCETKRSCDKVAMNLQDLGVPCSAIHGDLPQPARDRALARFARGELAVLVATDVAARGIDVDGIDVVIHHTPAGDTKDYLHRSGRTARAGRDGWAVTLAEYNQHLACRIIQRQLRLPLTAPIEVFSNNPKLKDLRLLEQTAAD